MEYSEEEKGQIKQLIQEKIDPMFSLNGPNDYELDGKLYQGFSVRTGTVSVLYILSNEGVSDTKNEEITGRLCKKYEYALGRFVKFKKKQDKIEEFTLSNEIDALK